MLISQRLCALGTTQEIRVAFSVTIQCFYTLYSSDESPGFFCVSSLWTVFLCLTTQFSGDH